MGFDVLTALLVIVGVVVAQAMGQRPRVAEAMQLTASRLGLVERGDQRAIGESRGLRVSLAGTERGGVEVVIAGVADGIDFARPALLRKKKEDERLRIGDPDFDGALVIAAGSHAALGCLDASTRARVLWALRCCDALRAEGGALIARIDDGPALDRAVEALLDVAEALRAAGGDEATLERRLTENAFRDPCLGVRRRCLEALLATSDHRVDRAERALLDPEPSIRILGALALGESGWHALRGDRVVEAELLAEVWDRAMAEPARLARVSGLAAVGGTRAMRSLTAMSWSLRVSPALRRQAAAAAQRIEGRDRSVEVGAVSLIPLDDRAAGALSVIDAGVGSISVKS